ETRGGLQVSIASILYAFQILPGHDEGFGFAETKDEAIAQAREHREDIQRSSETNNPIGAIAVYEMALRDPTRRELINILEERTTLLKVAVVSKHRVAVVAD